MWSKNNVEVAARGSALVGGGVGPADPADADKPRAPVGVALEVENRDKINKSAQNRPI